MSNQWRVSMYMVTILQCTQEQKVCNMEIEIVTLVVKGNVRLYKLTGENLSRKQKCSSLLCL